MIPRSLRVVAAALAPLVLASCGLTSNKVPPPCPPIYILSDAGKVTKYREGRGRDLTDVVAEAEILGYQGGCTYDDKGAIVDLQVSLGVKRGPGDVSRQVDLSYFVAIPLYFPSPDAKAVFPVTVTFPEGANYARFTDETVTMRIPVKDADVIQRYEVYLGFQTSQEELERNRQGR